MKKLFALLMALVLVISAVPLMASATQHPGGGEEPGECPHTAPYDYFPVTGTTHEVKCKCGWPMGTAECVFDGGACACGNVCPHNGAQKLASNNNGTHNAVCATCGGVMAANIPCEKQGDSCACGWFMGCKHEGAQKLVSNEDGKTHNAVCGKCGEVMSVNIPCEKQANGKCACNRDMTCKHEGAQTLVTNSDGKTHNAYCAKCGELMAKEIKCVKQADGKCACGRVMTGKPVVDPTLDKVPKTGDVLAPVALLSGLMSTVGLAVKKFFF